MKCWNCGVSKLSRILTEAGVRGGNNICPARLRKQKMFLEVGGGLQSAPVAELGSFIDPSASPTARTGASGFVSRLPPLVQDLTLGSTTAQTYIASIVSPRASVPRCGIYHVVEGAEHHAAMSRRQVNLLKTDCMSAVCQSI